MSITSPVSASDIREFADDDEELSEDVVGNLFARSISPSLAVRLGEAAAGYVSSIGYEKSERIYFVASYAPVLDPTEGQVDYEVFSPFPDADDADKFRKSKGKGYGVFGPFSLAPNELNVGYTNRKQKVVGNMELTPFANLPGGLGITNKSPFSWNGYDAVFMTEAAVEKFVIPYYTSVYGADFAGKILPQFSDAPVALMGHLPWTEYQIDEKIDGKQPPADVAHRTVHSDLLHFTKEDEHGNITAHEVRPPAPRV
jgi:hypothetical protein